MNILDLADHFEIFINLNGIFKVKFGAIFKKFLNILK